MSLCVPAQCPTLHRVQVWDATGNDLLLVHTLTEAGTSTAQSPSGSDAMPGGSSSAAAAADSDSKSAAGDEFLDCIRANCAVAVPETGNILVGTSQGTIAVFNCTDKGVSYCHSVSAHNAPVAGMAVDGTTAVSVDEGGNACTWDVSTMNTKRVFSMEGCVSCHSPPCTPIICVCLQ